VIADLHCGFSIGKVYFRTDHYRKTFFWHCLRSTARTVMSRVPVERLKLRRSLPIGRVSGGAVQMTFTRHAMRYRRSGSYEDR